MFSSTGMTSDIDAWYDRVNSFMRLVGEEPFSQTGGEDPKAELKSLIDRYTERVRAKNPAWKTLPDAAIPDALLQPLWSAYAAMPGQPDT